MENGKLRNSPAASWICISSQNIFYTRCQKNIKFENTNIKTGAKRLRNCPLSIVNYKKGERSEPDLNFPFSIFNFPFK